MMRTKLAAVVSSANAQGAPLRTQHQDCTHAGSHGLGNCRGGQTVDNDL